MLSGYVKFGPKTKTVNVRVGVSFISIDQARKNLNKEIPDGTSLEETAKKTRTEWAEKLDRIQISGATTAEKQIFYTGFFHTLQVGNLSPLFVLRACKMDEITSVPLRAR
jgi:putative alpha-1,2-mannosidase